jgi:hypothetical protein
MTKNRDENFGSKKWEQTTTEILRSLGVHLCRRTCPAYVHWQAYSSVCEFVQGSRHRTDPAAQENFRKQYTEHVRDLFDLEPLDDVSYKYLMGLVEHGALLGQNDHSLLFAILYLSEMLGSDRVKFVMTGVDLTDPTIVQRYVALYCTSGCRHDGLHGLQLLVAFGANIQALRPRGHGFDDRERFRMTYVRGMRAYARVRASVCHWLVSSCRVSIETVDVILNLVGFGYVVDLRWNTPPAAPTHALERLRNYKDMQSPIISLSLSLSLSLACSRHAHRV